MYFEEALRNELMTISGLNNKVFPLSATEGIKTPYLVYVSSEGLPEKDLDGYDVGSKEIHCELHILHDSYGAMKDTTRQVITKITGFQGRVIGGTGGVKILDLEYDKPSESYIGELFQYLSVIGLTVRI